MLALVLAGLCAQVASDDAALEAIANRLKGPDAQERERTVSQLDLLPLDRARLLVPAVVALLKSPQQQDRMTGVAAVRMLRFAEFAASLKPLLKDADADVRMNTIFAVPELRFEEMYAGLVEVLKSGTPHERRTAAERLGTLTYPAAVPALSAALQDKDDAVVLTAADALGRMKAKQAIPTLQALFKRAEVGARIGAASGLGWLEDRRVVGPLRNLLKDPEPGVRATAALSLSCLGAKEAVADLVRLLADPESQVRGTAALALSNLDAKSASPAVAKLLADPETDVLQAALRSLGVLDAKEALPRVVERIGHADHWVGQMALFAARRIGGPYALQAIRKEFQAENVFLRGWATEAYFDAAPLPDIRALLAEMSPDPNFAPNLGGTALSFSLNRFRAPELWDKLRATPLEGDVIGSPKEILERVAAQAGLKLVSPAPSIVHDQSWAMGRMEVRNPGRRLSLLDALRCFANLPTGWGGHFAHLHWNFGFWTVLLEPGQIRVLSACLPEQEGREFWKQWVETETKKK